MVLPTALLFRDVVFMIAQSPLKPHDLFLRIQYACVKKKFVRDTGEYSESPCERNAARVCSCAVHALFMRCSCAVHAPFMRLGIYRLPLVSACRQSRAN